MLAVLFPFLLCAMAIYALTCVFRYGDLGLNERREIRILIGQLFGMGYLPTQISEIMDLYY